MAFESVAGYLVDFGLLDIVIPFILTFVIVYGILQQSKVLGERKQVHATVAVVMGLMVVASISLVEGINALASYGGLAVILGVLALILGKWLGFKGNQIFWPFLIIFAGLLIYLLQYVWVFPSWRRYLSILLPIAVFAIVIWLIVREPSEPAKSKSKSKPAEE